jgi:hypothetical protein
MEQHLRQKLFVIYIGGRTAQSLIELHDMRFVIAEKIEDTYQELKNSWWGLPESLHLDCWGALEFADGYQLSLVPKGSESNFGLKLYFINLGGYSPNEFTELHQNIFIVAENEAVAKQKALTRVKTWSQGHKDHLYEVESVFCINQVADKNSLSIQLTKTEAADELKFDFGYVPIGKKNLT